MLENEFAGTDGIVEVNIVCFKHPLSHFHDIQLWIIFILIDDIHKFGAFRCSGNKNHSKSKFDKLSYEDGVGHL